MGKCQPLWLLVKELPSLEPLSPILSRDEPTSEIPRRHLFILQGEEARRARGCREGRADLWQSWFSDLPIFVFCLTTQHFQGKLRNLQEGQNLLFGLPSQHQCPSPQTPHTQTTLCLCLLALRPQGREHEV